MSDMIRRDSANVAEVKTKTETLLAEMAMMKITDETQVAVTADWLKRCKVTQTFVRDAFEAQRKQTYDAYQDVLKAVKEWTDPLVKAEKSVRKMLSDYETAQARIRAEEVRKIQTKLAAEEEERRLIQAIETGDESILDKSAPIVQVRTAEAPKVDGLSYVNEWRWEITDVEAIPMDYYTLNEPKINAAVRSQKGATKIPGVRVFSVQVPRVR